MGDATLLGIRISILALPAAILAVVGIVAALLRWMVRRKVRRDEAAAAGETASRRQFLHWLDRGLEVAVPPLALLLWVFGGYAALSTALADAAPSSAAALSLGVAVWVRDVATVATLFWLLSRLGRVVEAALVAIASSTTNTWDDILLPVAAKAARFLPLILALILGVQTLSIPAEYQNLLRTGLSLVLIGSTAYLLYQSVEAVEAMVLRRYEFESRDNLQARAVYTQVTVLKKVATAAISIFTVGSMLMVFESVRQFGTSILASAGIAGIVVGFAAQRSIATLLAGLQIAITQPIRLDDVVIVENEWGRSRTSR